MILLIVMLKLNCLLWIAFLLYVTTALVPHVFRNGPCRAYDPMRVLLWFIAISFVTSGLVTLTYPPAGLSVDAIAARMGASVLSSLCSIVALIMMRAYRGL